VTDGQAERRTHITAVYARYGYALHLCRTAKQGSHRQKFRPGASARRPAHAHHKARNQPRDWHTSLGCHATHPLLRNSSTLGCYIILLSFTRYIAHCVKTWCYPQKWKCITYCIVVEWSLNMRFLRYATRQRQQTDIHVDIHVDRSTVHRTAIGGEVINK